MTQRQQEQSAVAWRHYNDEERDVWRMGGGRPDGLRIGGHDGTPLAVVHPSYRTSRPTRSAGSRHGVAGLGRVSQGTARSRGRDRICGGVR